MRYELVDSVAILHLDDGKRNVVSNAFIAFVNEGLDRAEQDGAGAVLLHGREDCFSAGFDLKEFAKGVEEGIAMVEGGMALSIRLFEYPKPVVVACTGHAIAMGGFLLLSCDTRIGTQGEYRICLPETKINMTIPLPMEPLCHARISPRFMTRAFVQAEDFIPEVAVEVGFLDEVVAPGEVFDRAMTVAREFADLPAVNYAGNKHLIRGKTLEQMKSALAAQKAQMSG